MATTTTSLLPNSLRDVYSKEIFYQAQPKMRFQQFAKRKDDLLQQKGGTVKYTKFNSIQKGGKLSEGVSLSEKAMGDAEISITVDEYGNAVAVSEKALRLSQHDVLNEAATLLAKDMADVLDDELRDSALSTTNYLYGGQKSAANLLAAGDVFDTTLVKDAVEALATNNAPKIADEYYICIAHPHQLRQLRDDDDWIEAHKYATPENLFRGEVGMFEGVRFIDTTKMPANSAGESLTKYGVNIPTYEAVIFGENSFAWAVANEVEMRDNGVEDYGRKVGLAWYAIWGFGIIEEGNIFGLLTT